jgi:ankyrin repeat protein
MDELTASEADFPNDKICDDQLLMFNSDTISQIKQAKKDEPSKFKSHWEADEDDIESWSPSDIKNDPGKLLLTLAEDGKLAEMQTLLKSAQSPSALLMYKDSDGYTAMHRAAYSSQLEVVRYLCTFESSSNLLPQVKQLEAKTDMGWTPLHSACYWNAFTVVDFLVNQANADVNIRSNSGQTPLHLAAQQSTGRETILILLMHPDIDFLAENDQQETAQTLAQRMCKYHSLFEMADINLNKL